jgi:hypothetical protein
MMRLDRTRFLVLVVLGVALPSMALADVPEMIGFQGVLTNLDDIEVSAPGGIKMTFRLYNTSVGGSDLWSDTFSSVAVDNGNFFVLLGAGNNPFPVLELDGTIKYVGLSVSDGPELEPRMQLVSVPYALRAGTASTAAYAEDAGKLGGFAASDFLTKNDASDLTTLSNQVDELEIKVQVLIDKGGCPFICAENETGCTDDGEQIYTCVQDAEGCWVKTFSGCPGDFKCAQGLCTCVADYSLVCVGDNVYKQDSCGVTGTLDNVCGEGKCMGGSCVTWKRVTPLPLSGMNDMITIDSHLYAVGDGGQIVHFDGLEWTHMASFTTKDLHSIWGYYANGVVLYAVGEDGKILRYEANKWTTEITEIFSNLNDIYGRYSAASEKLDLFVVGDDGILLTGHGGPWTTEVWEEEATWTTTNLHSVWAPNAGSQVWIGGENGTMVHYDTENWITQESGASTSVVGLWGVSVSTLWGVTNGQILRFKNGAWLSESYGDTGVNFHAIWGEKDENLDVTVFAVADGGKAYTSDASADGWIKSAKVESNLSGSSIRGVHGGAAPSDGTWIVTQEGKYAYRNIDTKWIFPSIDRGVTAFWGMPGSQDDLWGVGDDCLAIRYIDEEWLEVKIAGGTCADGSGSNDFRAMWGNNSGTLIFAVGDSLFKTWDGSAWVDGTAPPDSAPNADIWGVAKTDDNGDAFAVLYVVRSDNTWFWNGTTWQDTAGGAGTAGWGTSTSNFYVVTGSSGNVKHFDGSEWQSTTVSANALTAIYGTGANDIWAVGVKGAVHHYNGSWSDLSVGEDLTSGLGKGSTLNSVWMDGLSPVYAAAGNGYVYRYNNGTWYQEQTFPAKDHNVVYGTSASSVWLGGDTTIYTQ